MEGYPYPVDWGYPIQLTGVPHLADGGTPWSGQDWMGVPPSELDRSTTHLGNQMGTPWSGLDEGTPLPSGLDVVPHHRNWMGYPPPIWRQSSRARAFYVAGGMPLAFTQDDFLVHNQICGSLIMSFKLTCFNPFDPEICQMKSAL